MTTETLYSRDERASEFDSSVDNGDYAECLDNCPGARATDGMSCPHPDPGAVCVETTKANAGGIVGGVLAGAAIVLLLVVLATVASFAKALP